MLITFFIYFILVFTIRTLYKLHFTFKFICVRYLFYWRWAIGARNSFLCLVFVFNMFRLCKYVFCIFLFLFFSYMFLLICSTIFQVFTVLKLSLVQFQFYRYSIDCDICICFNGFVCVFPFFVFVCVYLIEILVVNCL